MASLFHESGDDGAIPITLGASMRGRNYEKALETVDKGNQ